MRAVGLKRNVAAGELAGRTVVAVEAECKAAVAVGLKCAVVAGLRYIAGIGARRAGADGKCTDARYLAPVVASQTFQIVPL